MQRQELYIGQLERELAFCRSVLIFVCVLIFMFVLVFISCLHDIHPHPYETREQLGKVLTLVSVSGQEEGEAQLLLKRLQAVEEEVRGGEEKKEEERGKREEENRQLREQLKAVAASPVGDSELVADLRAEVANLKAKEAEAAEQVLIIASKRGMLETSCLILLKSCQIRSTFFRLHVALVSLSSLGLPRQRRSLRQFSCEARWRGSRAGSGA